MPHDGPHDEEHEHPPGEHGKGKCGPKCSHEEKPVTLSLAAQARAAAEGEPPNLLATIEHGNKHPSGENPPHGEPGHICGGGGHDHRELRLTVLAASYFGEDAAQWVSRHNTEILFGSSVALATADIASNILVGHSTMAQVDGLGEAIGAGGMVLSLIGMNDSSENLMDSAHDLEHSKGVPRFLTASMTAMSHQIPEAAVTGISMVAGNSAQNVASLYVGKITHLGTMLWSSAAVGTMRVVSPEHWKIHAKGMGGLSAAFAGPILLSDQIHPIVTAGVGAVMVLKIAPWYLKELKRIGYECIAHGPNCKGHSHPPGETHNHPPGEHNHPEDAKLSLAQKADELREGIENTPEFHATTTQRMTIPSKISHLLKRANEYRKDPAARKAFLSAASLGLFSIVMHDSANILSEAFALSATSTGYIRGSVLSASEAFITIKAALKKDRDMVWGSIAGCMAASGFLEGATLIANPDMPSLLKAAPQLSAYTLATAGSLAMVHPKTVRGIGRFKNNIADWGERNFGDRVRAVSDWLRNDEKTLAKEIAYPAAIASILYLGYASSLPDFCHSHGFKTHCGADVVEIDPNEVFRLE